MYEDFFEAGFRFSVSSFVISLLNFYNQAPTQLTPNSWRIIFCYLVLCYTYERKPNLAVFKKLFTMKSSGPDYRCIFVRRGSNFLSLSSRYSSNKGYKSRFFFAASSEWSSAGLVGWNFSTKWQDFDKSLDQEPDQLSPGEIEDYQFFRGLGMIHSVETLVASWHAWVGGSYEQERPAG